jgi:hypothetical protein
LTREENIIRLVLVLEQKVNDNLTLYFVNNPQGKDGYRHKQMDDNFAELIKEIKPDIAHIGHVNHLSTGLIDELNKLKIPIVFTLHDFWLMCPRGQFLTRSIGTKTTFSCAKNKTTKNVRLIATKFISADEKKTKMTEIENWSNWIHQ